MRAVRISEPRGVGGVSSTFILQQHGDTACIGPIHDRADADLFAKKLTELTHTRWDMIEEKITHTTVLAYAPYEMEPEE